MGSLYSKTKINYLKSPWPYWVGGLLLGLVNVVLLALTGMSWQVTGGILLWGVGILEWFGLDPFSWAYFNQYNAYYDPIMTNKNVFINQYSLLNIGIIVGSLVATLVASEFKFKKIKSKRQVVLGFLGGILMGYSSRIAVGCNIGAFFSGIPSFSLHGWVFGVFILLGTGAGLKILKGSIKA